MRASDLQRNALVTTAAVAEAAKDPATLDYIQTCLSLFFSGMYGKMGPEDTELNEEELRAGVIAWRRAAAALSSIGPGNMTERRRRSDGVQSRDCGNL